MSKRAYNESSVNMERKIITKPLAPGWRVDTVAYF